ncbi:MAG: hypothetical protein ACLGI6_22520, partial [Gammaproteobacteria bacterium]
GVGKKGSGKYALMHAHAFKLFEAKGEFSYHHVHHDSRRHRMQLQWVPAKDQADGAYELQIRVNCPYGDGIQIQYHITELWFDPAMDGCVGGGRP